MIASLPMYWFPETGAAHGAFWALVRDSLRAQGLEAPDDLDTTLSPHDVWSAEDLVLSHICNLPYRLRYRDRLTRIAASDYGLPGCGPGQYRALFVVRIDHPAESPGDLDGATMAINAEDSHSGWGAAAVWAQENGLRFRPVLVTGSHEGSVEAVAGGRAEFATIDARSLEILLDINRLAGRLKVIGATDPAPGMTFVTRAGQDPAPYLAALRAGLDGLADTHRPHLGLKGVAVLPDEAYDLPVPPDPTDWRG